MAGFLEHIEEPKFLRTSSTKVRGIEIVFSADDPSSLMGKTIGVANRKFFD
jgi:hypothetical protein